MSFDTLAPHYRWMEWVAAGNKLQRCRTAFLSKLDPPKRVLIPGEGNGRFLVECRRAFPRADITCVDASARMLALAKRRLQQTGFNGNRVEFIHADVLEWTPPGQGFDLVVTHFFLDCFRPEQLEVLIPRLADAGASRVAWLLADFQAPAGGWRRWRAQLVLWGMHCFFRVATRLPARRLTPPDAYLQNCGFRLCRRQVSEWGLLHSDHWERRMAST